MTVQFGKFETRDQVAKRLEKPVRAYLTSERNQQSDLVGPEAWTDMHVILAELDRIDRVQVAQHQVNMETALRDEAARQSVLDSVLVVTGPCSQRVGSDTWAHHDSACKHTAKSSLPGGQPLCGVHFRRPLETAVRQAQFGAVKVHRSEEPSEAEKAILEDKRLCDTREIWVR